MKIGESDFAWILGRQVLRLDHPTEATCTVRRQMLLPGEVVAVGAGLCVVAHDGAIDVLPMTAESLRAIDANKQTFDIAGRQVDWTAPAAAPAGKPKIEVVQHQTAAGVTLEVRNTGTATAYRLILQSPDASFTMIGLLAPGQTVMLPPVEGHREPTDVRLMLSDAFGQCGMWVAATVAKK